MKCRIYKLIDNTNGNVYYGSTIQQLNKREINHKADYKRYLDEKHTYITSFEIIKNNDYKIELVEEIEFETKDALHERERFYIENNDCVNKNIPNRTMKEYLKEYNKENKEKIAEKKKNIIKNIIKKKIKNGVKTIRKKLLKKEKKRFLAFVVILFVGMVYQNIKEQKNI